MFDPHFSVTFRASGRESQKLVKEPWPERYYTVTASKHGKRTEGTSATWQRHLGGSSDGMRLARQPRAFAGKLVIDRRWSR